MSIAPCSSRNSERWKPSGSFSRTVCSMTRGSGEADQRLRLGCCESPSIANDARRRRWWDASAPRCTAGASRRRPSAADVLAICISENIDSCMRAPPTRRKFHERAADLRAVSGRAGESALADHGPIEHAHEREVEGRRHQRTAVQRALHRHQRHRARRWISARRGCGRNTSSGRGTSARRPGRAPRRSARWCPRRTATRSGRRARIAMWKPHFGQTSRFSSSSAGTARSRSGRISPTGLPARCGGVGTFSADARGHQFLEPGHAGGSPLSDERPPRGQRVSVAQGLRRDRSRASPDGAAGRSLRRPVRRAGGARKARAAAAGSLASASAETSALPTTTPSAIATRHRRGARRILDAETGDDRHLHT